MILDFDGDRMLAMLVARAFDLIDLDTGLPVARYIYADDQAGIYRGYLCREIGSRCHAVEIDPATSRPRTFERQARVRFVARTGCDAAVAKVHRILAYRAWLQRGAYI